MHCGLIITPGDFGRPAKKMNFAFDDDVVLLQSGLSEPGGPGGPRGTGGGDWGVMVVPPDFGRSIKPISTNGTRL